MSAMVAATDEEMVEKMSVKMDGPGEADDYL
jgi:hypothetical protein